MLSLFGIFEIFIDKFSNLKILHDACHNLSQSDITKTLCPIQAVIIFVTYDLEYFYMEIKLAIACRVTGGLL